MTAKVKTPDRNATERIITHITHAKDEIIEAIKDHSAAKGRPFKSNPKARGPKETRMMKIQRTALIVYVTVELHKNILDVTLADAYHVWNDPENAAAWNDAAKRKDHRRGYKDYTTLYGVVKNLAEKHKLNIAKITAV